MLNTAAQGRMALEHHCQTAHGLELTFCPLSPSSKVRLWTKLGRQQRPVYHAFSFRLLVTTVGVGSVLQAELDVDSDTGFPSTATDCKCCFSFLLTSVLSSSPFCIGSCKSSANFLRPVGEGSDDLDLSKLSGRKMLVITVCVLGW